MESTFTKLINDLSVQERKVSFRSSSDTRIINDRPPLDLLNSDGASKGRVIEITLKPPRKTYNMK